MGRWSKLAFGIGLALLPGCGSSTTTETLRLGHGLDTSHPVHRAMQAMATRVAAESAGRLRIEIYPNEQLGSERECLELLQVGSLGLTKVSAAVLENFAPAFRVLSAPYLFRSDAHRWAVLEGPIGRDLLREPRPYRLLGLAYYDAGTRSFYTRERAVETPEDLRGQKIRTQESPTAIALVEALGAAPAPLSWGELYTALQQGVVDGAENNPPSYHLSGHYQVAPHLSLDEHTAVPDVLLIGTETWDRLPRDAQRLVADAARASVALQRELWREATETALRAVVAGGARIHRPDPAPFVAGTGTVRSRMAEDPVLGPWLQRIEATR